MAEKQIKFVFEGDTGDLEKALASVSRGFEKTKKESKELAKDVSVFGRKFDQSADKIGKFMSVNAKSFAAIGVGVGVVIAGMVAVAKAAEVAIGVVKKITDETMAMAEAGDEVAKSAKKIGTTAEELQVIRFALGEGGVAAEQADMAMLKLNLRLAQVAETGKGPAAEALKKLGLSAKELQDLPLDERMATLADAFDNLGSQGEKTAAAVSLMEEGGLQMLSAFDGGGDTIRASAAEIKDLGVISNESAAASEAQVDAIGRLDSALDGLRFQVLAPLIPVITGVARGIKQLLAQLDAGDIKKFARTVAKSMDTAIQAFAGLGLAAEVTFLSMGPAIDAAQAVLLLGTGDVVGAALNMKAALEGALDLGEAIDKAKRRWVGMSNTIRVHILAAAREAESGSDRIERALDPDLDLDPGGGGGGGGGRGGGRGGGAPSGAAAGGLTLGGGTVSITDDLEVALSKGGTVSTEDDIEAHAEFLKKQAGEIVDAFSPVADAFDDIAGSLGDLFSQAASNIADTISESEAEIADLDERIAEATTDREWKLLEGRKRMLQEELEEQKKAAKAMFVAQKVVSLSQAAVATALAVITGFAQGGPPLAIAAGIAGGIAIATIAAEPPPSFHSGGMVSMGAPDEITARLLRSEAVLSPQGVSAAGGEDGVRDLNRGAGGQQPVISVLQVRSRVVDAMISDNLRQKQGPLTDALRAARPRALGRHNPFASS